MIWRAIPDQQIELFEKPSLYMSQADAADYLGVTTRKIQYWESNELLHPKHEQGGRQRQYSEDDLVEMLFIKTMLEDQGYTVPALKEKLASLEFPYYYDGRDMHWDLNSQSWKTSTDIAVGEISNKRELLTDIIANAILDMGNEVEPRKMALSLLRAVESGLKGKISKAKRSSKSVSKRRSRKKPTPAPLFEENEAATETEIS